MVQTLHNIEIPSTFSDREVRATFLTDQDYAAFYIKAVGYAATSRLEQFAYINKEELLDALAQIGWLPDEYRKPKPLDPREAKIREVALLLANSDRRDDGMRDLADYEALENDRYTDETAYRKNAEALIDAGLVKVDTE